MTPQQTIETEPTRTEAFAAWIQSNTRLVGIGAVVVVAAGIGWWFYLRSAEIRRANAERGLNQAKQSLAAGNPALAKTDLERVAARYTGTPSGAQAAMLLAQLNYDQGNFDAGIAALAPYDGARSAGPNLGAVLALKADGQLLQGKPEDAARTLQRAAESTSMPGERSIYWSRAAKALVMAGKTTEARDIWQRLLDDPEAHAVQNEARIRLSELTVQPAKGSS